MASAPMGAALRQIQRVFGEGTLSGLTDSQILEKFVDGRDEAAFTALVGRHGTMVLETCRAVLRNADAAEDAFQATFLVLVCKARSIRGRDARWLAPSGCIELGGGADRDRRRHLDDGGRPRSQIIASHAPEQYQDVRGRGAGFQRARRHRLGLGIASRSTGSRHNEGPSARIQYRTTSQLKAEQPTDAGRPSAMKGVSSIRGDVRLLGPRSICSVTDSNSRKTAKVRATSGSRWPIPVRGAEVGSRNSSF